MSVVINHAAKYTYIDLEDVSVFHRKLINIVQDRYTKIMNELTADVVAHVLISMIIYNNNEHHRVYIRRYIKDLLAVYHLTTMEGKHYDLIIDIFVEAIVSELDRIDWDDETQDDTRSLFITMREIASKVNFIFVTNRTLDRVLNVFVNLYHYKDFVLLIANEETPNLTMHESVSGTNNVYNKILNISGVEDYEYQNSSDRPKEVPEKYWNQRIKDWEAATTSAHNSLHLGNGSCINCNNPRDTSVIPFMFTFHDGKHNEATKDFIKAVCARYDDVIGCVYRSMIDEKIEYTFPEDIGWVSLYSKIRSRTVTMIKNNIDDYISFAEKCDKAFIPVFEHFKIDKELIEEATKHEIKWR